MNIVLEGPDGGGKSTLAQVLCGITRMPVVAGEGPPKAPGEINERAHRYLTLDWVIFDRHPCVSQEIYGAMRCTNGKAREEMIEPATLKAFYNRETLFIYCKPGPNALDIMTVGADENPEHIAAVYRNYAQLKERYEQWALTHAHFIYRIGEQRPIEDLAHGVRTRILSDKADIPADYIEKLKDRYRESRKEIAALFRQEING